MQRLHCLGAWAAAQYPPNNTRRMEPARLSLDGEGVPECEALPEGEPEVSGALPEPEPGRSPLSTLECLPEDALLAVLTCGALSALDLGRLERTHPRFWHRKGSAVGICAAAAARLLAARPDAHRVQPRHGESAVFVLEALERRLPHPAPIAVGDYHTIALAQDQVLWSFGKGEHGQLGHGATTEWQPLAELWNAQELVPKEIRTAGPVCGVAAGAAHSAAVAMDGAVYTWGSSALGHGAQGWGSANAVSAPRRVALSGDASVGAAYVAAGDAYTACIMRDGSLYTWGSESRGRLGHGGGGIGLSPGGGISQQLVPRKVGGELARCRVAFVDCGYRAMAALTARGELHMCGNLPRHPDSEGWDEGHRWEDTWLPVPVAFPLAGGVAQRRPFIVSVSCGHTHFAAACAAGTIYTWGSGSNGQLGHGSTASEALPRPVTALQSERVTTVSCGVSMTAAVTARGELYTWGDQHGGQLGHGRMQRCMLPRRVSVAAASPGTTQAAGEGEVPPAPPEAEEEEEEEEEESPGVVVAVACGVNHSAILLDNGGLATFGRGEVGQLGHGRKASQGMPTWVEAMPPVHIEPSRRGGGGGGGAAGSPPLLNVKSSE
jgi:alpha-tubulin suppressor-like RCC1 family protein